MIKIFMIVLIMLAISTVVELLMLMWLKFKKWEQKPMTPLEETALIFFLRNIPDLRFALILFTVVFPISGFFLFRSEIEMWIFFIIFEFYLVIGVVFFQKIEKIIRNKFSLSQSEIKEKSKLKEKYRSLLNGEK